MDWWKNQKTLLGRAEKVKKILGHCPLFILEINPAGEILYLNKYIEGFSEEEVIGKKIYDYFSKEQHQMVQDSITKLLQTREPVDYEVTSNLPEGLYQFSSKMIPIIEDDEISRIICLSEDVTIKRMTERTLLEASKMAVIGELAGAVTHEINNPLAVIKGYLGVIQSELKKMGINNEKINGALKAQAESAGRIEKMSYLLKKFMKKNKEHDCFDLHEVVENTVIFYELLFARHLIEFETKLCGKRVMVDGDTDCFYQIISSLFNNAKDAFVESSKRKITVSSFVEGDEIVVRIEDNGPGIPQSELPYVFDLSYSSCERDVKVGLNLSYHLTHAMGGKIKVQSNEKEGSCFEVILPIAREKESIHEETNDQQACTERFLGRALVIEDEAHLNGVLAGILRSFGLEVNSCLSGEEALRQMSGNKYDYIFTDLNLPGTSGAPFLRRIFNQARCAKIIVVTGGSLLSEKKFESYQRQVASVISKPFTRKMIYQELREMNRLGQSPAVH